MALLEPLGKKELLPGGVIHPRRRSREAGSERAKQERESPVAAGAKGDKPEWGWDRAQKGPWKPPEGVRAGLVPQSISEVSKQQNSEKRKAP